MIAIHPYIRYAQALIMVENDLISCEDITEEHLIIELEKGLNSFRVQPIESIENKEKVRFNFVRVEKGDPPKGIFLAPNVISKDQFARYIWKEGALLIEDLKKGKSNKLSDASMSVAPIAGEYLSFSLQNKIGRGKSKISTLEQGLSAITTLSLNKPCFQYRINKKETPNACIIPDLQIDQLMNFIEVYKRMIKVGTESDLMYGNVISKTPENGETEKASFEVKRPLLFKGNFPNPPRSSSLGCIALLGAIGEFSKEAQYSEQANLVLESLKEAIMYLIRYGNASTFSYNHHVIDLAKQGKLKTIIDSLYYSTLYNKEKRSSKEVEYQKFDLFTGRFLQQFNHASFKDFLAFRAEYPDEVIILFNIYFIKMEKIDPAIVSSARAFGKWLNKVAYLTAKSEVDLNDSNAPKYWEQVRKVKSKVLIELESSTFSAKSGDALIAQVITRAGRLSGLDSPEASSLFMEKAASGELPLENAKNLVIAFSRLINKVEDQSKPKGLNNDEDLEDCDEVEEHDYSEI